MKLLIIGIDSLDPRILMNNINMFPNIKKLIGEGIFKDYYAYAYGYGSRDNWSTIYTGLEPNKHGIINNKYKDSDSEFNISLLDGLEPIWDILNENDISLGMWKGLMTSPGKKINGYMITGEYSFEFGDINHSLDGFDPQCENKEILSIIKGEASKPKPIGTFNFENNLDFNKILEKDDYYTDGLKYLKKELEYYKNNIMNVYEKFPTDVIYFYSLALDPIQHFQQYDSNKRIIIESIIEYDKFIGEMIDKLAPENIIILSDHGSSSFKESVLSKTEEIEREAFGWSDKSYWLNNGQIITKSRVNGILSGFHDVLGTFIISGKYIDKNKDIKDMRSIDIYPTILELLDIEVPKGRNGHILDIFNDSINIKNKNMILKNKDVEEKILDNDILLIQSITPHKFNSVLNELFLNTRFNNIDIIVEGRFMNMYKLNPRVRNIYNFVEYSEVEWNDYKEVYVSTEDRYGKLNYNRVK